MLYSILRVIVRWALKLYFRKIDISGIEHLKPGQAQILASNHPSGFLEPLLMACFFPRDLYFLVRGDVFKNRFARVLLEATHQIPIFRFKDGFSNLRNNADSIQAASSILIKKKCLLIFVEGGTQSVKMLRPLQKGFIKLASETLQKENNLALEVLPVGINFSDSTKAGSEVMIKIGTPILVNHEQLNPGNSRNAASTNELLEETFHAMKKNIIHLEDVHRSEILEWSLAVHQLFSNRNDGKVVTKSDQYLSRCISLATQLNALDGEKVKVLKNEVNAIEKNMKEIGVTRVDLVKENSNFLKLAGLILFFLPAFIGLLIHFIPLYTAKTLAKKLAPSKEFFGSIWLVLSILLSIFFYFIFILLGVFNVIPWFFPLLSVPLGLFSHFYFFRFHNFWILKPSGFSGLLQKNELLFNQYFNNIYNQVR